MRKTLRIEWLKIRNYTAFKVIALFFVVGIAGTNYLMYYFKKNVVDRADPTGMLFGGSPFGFPKVWQTVSYYSGCLLLLPGLLLLILVTNEYTYKTARQNIIDGMSRRNFIHVKLLLGLLMAIASTILVFLTALIFGFSMPGDFYFFGIENLGYFFLKALSYNCIAVLLAVLIRRTGFAIAVYFIYAVFENGLSILMLVWAVNIKRNGGPDLGNMGNYLPMNASDGLLYSPFGAFTKMANRIMPADYFWLVFTLALVYLALFIVWSRAKFLRADL